ncbi:hypothetical protein GCM10010124_06600 [Pilimelia terevasa]|uniref:DinB-like domain-containing protein n=1 Tax=Pilimelia terevasa TaxID=53372 RepID=A0A8J3BI90_9ACTN|nr:DinB family protein [Pilimelia terevasa]GGK16650.1 hypothetical protein GCM10010124_06600 [Pilimelia terevasa]
MDVAHLLRELYGRLPALVHGAVEGLTPAQLVARPAADANPVGWLGWHLARVQDHHVADLLAEDQVWTEGDQAARFGLPADPENTGYGHTAPEVAEVRPESWQALTGYLGAVSARTDAYLGSLDTGDLDRVVDASWDPPVTLGVRLVSVADDGLQHAGQAAYARGILGF